MGIHVIVNTTARHYERAPHLVSELHAVSRGRATFHATADLDELDGACAEAAAAESEIVVLTGGDGSLMSGVTAVAAAFGERLPKIGFLRAGTAAIVSKNWGLRGEPAEQLSRILAGGTTLRSERHPTLRVRAETAGGVEERVGFIFGTGLVAKFFEVYYADGARGNAGAARLVARIFVESFVGGSFARRVLDPLPCSIEVDGAKLAPDAFSLVCAAVVRDLGLHMIVNYRAGEDPGRPHLVVNALPTRRLGRRMPRVLAGKPIGGEGGFDGLCERFSVRFPPGGPTQGEGPYVLDGDLLAASCVTVTGGPLLDVIKP
jgi:diacylglycerol kinase (ATP)